MIGRGYKGYFWDVGNVMFLYMGVGCVGGVILKNFINLYNCDLCIFCYLFYN